jgi:hypothetical protein
MRGFGFGVGVGVGCDCGPVVLAVVEPDLGPKFWHLGGAFAHLSLFARQTLNLISGRGRSEQKYQRLRICMTW